MVGVIHVTPFDAGHTAASRFVRLATISVVLSEAAFNYLKITWVCSFGVYELFPKPLGGNTSAFSECREFRPDNVGIDRGLSYPSSVSAITAGDYVLPSD